MLTACALSPGTSGGGAAYKYARTETGCTLEISSSRDITDGSISIDKDCSLTTSLDSGKGVGNSAFKAIDSLVSRIPLAP